MSTKRRSNKLGQRTHNSQFQPFTFTNNIKGLYVKYKDNDVEEGIERCALLAATNTLKNGVIDGTANEGFKEITETELNAIIERLGGKVVTDVAQEARAEKDTRIYIFATDDSRDTKGNLITEQSIPQSRLHGLSVGGKVLSKDCEVRIYTETTCNWHNNAYKVKDTTSAFVGEFIIKGERITKLGIRCLFFKDEDGNIVDKHALYMAERPFFTDEKDAKGELYSNFSPKDCLKTYQAKDNELCEEFGDDTVTWEYDVDVYLMPQTLINTYKSEGIVSWESLDNANDRGVFDALPEGFDTLESYDSGGETEEQGRDWIKEIQACKNAAEAQALAVESGEMSQDQAQKYTSKDKVAKRMALLLD